jgi:hypothetical protein
LRSAGLDADNSDTWVVWATIVLAVAEIAKPRLQRRRVVLLDDGAIGLDRGVTGDGCPLARVGDETEVDRRMLFEVVGLAGLGVGVEE